MAASVCEAGRPGDDIQPSVEFFACATWETWLGLVLTGFIREIFFSRREAFVQAASSEMPISRKPNGTLGRSNDAVRSSHMHVDLMRDKSVAFPDIGNAASLTGLRVWHCKYKTLEPISKMRKLRALEIATYPDEKLDFLVDLHRLEWLSIVHFPKIKSLAPLANMKSLRWLELATLPSWDSSRKRTRVASLSPLAELPLMEHLSLLGVVPEDLSLAPIKASNSLKTAVFFGFEKSEIESFFADSSVQKQHIKRHELLPDR